MGQNAVGRRIQSQYRAENQRSRGGGLVVGQRGERGHGSGADEVVVFLAFVALVANPTGRAAADGLAAHASAGAVAAVEAVTGIGIAEILVGDTFASAA